jgi:hypothetical protein
MPPKGGESDGKDVIYVTLVDAVSRGGCPICRAVEKSENSMLWIMLYEHVNDPHVRERIRRGNGFCAYHFQKIVEMARSDPLIGGLAPAIIVEDLLSRYIESVREGTTLETECFVCSELERVEESYTSSFASKLDTTDLLTRYESNPGSLLCYKHYLEVYSRASEPARERLREVQLRKMESLRSLLQSYIAKNDYRFIGTITEAEASSWVKAVEAIVGSGWSSHRWHRERQGRAPPRLLRPLRAHRHPTHPHG